MITAGRKPVHAFNSLKVGKKVLLEGSAQKYPHQFIGQFNKRRKEKLEVVNDNGVFYAKRIS